MSEVARRLRQCFINRIETTDHGDGNSTTAVGLVEPDALADYIEALERQRPLHTVIPGDGRHGRHRDDCVACAIKRAGARALAALGGGE